MALGGHAAVKVLARDGDTILMEWCVGPSPSDLVRKGQASQATDILCDTIQHLHAAAIDPARLPPLAVRFAPLHGTGADGGPRQRIARQHYDNILQNARGWLAIDPNGVNGDPAYEPANAFRNPDGAGDLVFRPD